MHRRLLLVDPDRNWLNALHDAVPPAVDVEVCVDFPTARTRLLADPPTLLVTKLRLGAYNGVHLVVLAASEKLPTRCLTYGERGDPTDEALGRMAQEAGAFYEPLHRLPFALPAYLRSDLPARDRRDPAREDRRVSFRGGRRITDSSKATARV